MMSILFGCCCCARTKKILKSAVSVNFENAITQIIGGAAAPPAPPLPTGLDTSAKQQKIETGYKVPGKGALARILGGGVPQDLLTNLTVI